MHAIAPYYRSKMFFASSRNWNQIQKSCHTFRTDELREKRKRANETKKRRIQQLKFYGDSRERMACIKWIQLMDCSHGFAADFFEFYRKIVTQCQSTHLPFPSYLFLHFVSLVASLHIFNCIVSLLFFFLKNTQPKMICNLPFGTAFCIHDGSNENPTMKCKFCLLSSAFICSICSDWPEPQFISNGIGKMQIPMRTEREKITNWHIRSTKAERFLMLMLSFLRN